MKSAVVITALFLASCGGSSTNSSPTGPTSTAPNACGETFNDPECHTIVVGGTTRAYLLHVPATFQANVGALLIGLHGSDGSGLRFVTTSQFNVKADQAGFAVAYPFALLSPGAGITEWNEFFNNSFGAAGPDDSAFVRQLILTTQASIHSDPRKTFVMGLSNPRSSRSTTGRQPTGAPASTPPTPFAMRSATPPACSKSARARAAAAPKFSSTN